MKDLIVRSRKRVKALVAPARGRHARTSRVRPYVLRTDARSVALLPERERADASRLGVVLPVDIARGVEVAR